MRKFFVFLPAIVALIIAFAMLRGWFGLTNGTWQVALPIVRIEDGLILTIIGVGLGVLGVGWLQWQAYQQRLISQRHAWQRELVENRLLYLRAIDHELQNPLHIMQAEIRRAESTAGNAARIPEIKRQAKRLKGLLTTVRKLVEVQSEVLELRSMGIAKLLAEVVEDVNGRFANAERTVRLDLPADPLPPVWGDEDLLLLALYNLVDNALKYTEADDKITVRASAKNHELVIQVLDQGYGIPDDEIADIHKEAQRGSNTVHIMGKGLGLMFVHTIVERHKGEMIIHSIEEIGTRVTLRLPLSQKSRSLGAD